MTDRTLIVPANFIQATRDSGYKSLGSAIAELVDNSFEAKAKIVAIFIERVSVGREHEIHVTVADDGIGMDEHTLRHALQFGWSSRFNQRDGHGRYGMGLPNASLSHAKRVDVHTTTDGKRAFKTFLDVDEIMNGRATLPEPEEVGIADFQEHNPFRRGTAVTWYKCDRLADRNLGPAIKRLRAELSRLFRYQLWAGRTIKVNGEVVRPFDPLFLRSGCESMLGAELHGGAINYAVAIGAGSKTSNITVRFSVLPIKEWHGLSNEDKNKHGIAKNAGVSVVRSGREIDRGWFFMGGKRKENYDDWWRCEVCFDPDLDELFGVTHTKQEIHPTEELQAILAPELEAIARELNGNARRTFTQVKRGVQRRRSEMVAERSDNLLEPPRMINAHGRTGQTRTAQPDVHIPGLQYRIHFQRLESSFLYSTQLKDGCVMVVMNESHPFVREIWPKEADARGEGNTMQRAIELVLLALARTELVHAGSPRDEKRIEDFRRSWSDTLATFLS